MKGPSIFSTTLDMKVYNCYCVVSERYGLSFLGCLLAIGGTYLSVAFGPNSHERLEAENIVKHFVGWPVLLYLVSFLFPQFALFLLVSTKQSQKKIHGFSKMLHLKITVQGQMLFFTSVHAKYFFYTPMTLNHLFMLCNSTVLLHRFEIFRS